MQIDLTLTEPQDDFVFSEEQYPLFVGGFGSGKSESLFKRVLLQKLQYPKLNQGYFAPSYDLINLIAFPRLTELLTECGLKFKLNKSEKVFHIQGYGQIICRSMDAPNSIVGFEIADAVIDELDTMEKLKAENAWNKIIARCRQKKLDGKANTAAVGTTPEGFRFCYDRWVKRGGKKYALYRAPTYSNPYLPESYIDGLRESYPPQLLAAYLDGEFVNLASGGVYPDFDRELNRSKETIKPREVLHIGMDFNVLKMAAVVFVLRDGKPHAVDELVNVRDTPAMAELIKERYKDHTIKIYPDAAGQATSSKNSSESDHIILRKAGFQLVVNGSNPAVKDRINACNAQILNSNGVRSLMVNVDKCPNLAEALEQQAYDKHGAPDKSTGHDHVCFSGETIVSTLDGDFRFDEIPSFGFVRGADGDWVSYSNAGLTNTDKITNSVTFADGYMIECTPDHKFLVSSGEWIESKNLSGKKCVLSMEQFRNSKGLDTTNAEHILQIIKKLSSLDFIGLFGGTILEKYQYGVMFIISTMMSQTIKLKTLLASQESNTIKYIQEHLKILLECESLLMRIDTSQKSGTQAKAVEIGIESIIRLINTNFTSNKKDFVVSVEKSLSSQFATRIQTKHSATETACLHLGVQVVSTMLRELASCVVLFSAQTNTLKTSDVMSIKENSKKDNVYCLTTKQGAFRLSERSPIVSNCDAYGYFIVKQFNIKKPIPKTNPFRMAR